MSYEDICHKIDNYRPAILKIEYFKAPGHFHVRLVYGYTPPDVLTLGDTADGTAFTVHFPSYCQPDAYNGPGSFHYHWTRRSYRSPSRLPRYASL